MYMCIFMCIYIHMNIYVYIHINIYIYITLDLNPSILFLIFFACFLCKVAAGCSVLASTSWAAPACQHQLGSKVAAGAAPLPAPVKGGTTGE